MRSFIIAVQFLTRIPLAPKMTVSDEEVGRSMGYFPLVGLCMGACLAAAHLLFAAVLPRGVADGLIVALLAALSGAIHLDGLADTADGIAGGKDREERLRIMKDPRIGAIGAVCVVLLIMLKYIALVALPGKLTYRALLLVPMIGRWAQVLVAYRSDYAGLSRGVGFTFTRQVTLTVVLCSSLPVAACAYYLFSITGVVAAVVILAASRAYAACFRRTLGGITGDVLGAATELAETAALILLVVRF
jgi:adenosylcobinamide-GDP ribazoletransferase